MEKRDETLLNATAIALDKTVAEISCKYTDGLRFLLTVSVTLLTLLLPLVIFAERREYNRSLLCGAVVCLLLSCLVSIGGIIWELHKLRNKRNYLRATIDFLKDEGPAPGEYRGSTTGLLACATICGVCFGSAVALLCGVLFQLFFS